LAVRADGVADFYRGRQVEIDVGFGAGGGYGLYTQVLARHLSKFIRGNPSITIKYMPGAGSIKSLNFVYNVAPRDGSLFAIAGETLPMFEILRPQGMKADFKKVEWIGRLGRMTNVIMVRGDAPATTIEAARKVQVILAANGKGDQTYLYPDLMNKLLGTKFKMVLGYPGSREMDIALERGEAQGRGGAWASWKAVRQDWIDRKFVVPLVRIGLEREPDLAKVPLLYELAAKDDDRAILRMVSSSAAVGRAYYAPPGVPKERVAALRTAFAKVVKDPEFLADARKRGITIEFMTGEELGRMVGSLNQASPAVIARAKALVNGN
jgi:tripartite-type tricarboxylate transporter receptor subunit TctC